MATKYLIQCGHREIAAIFKADDGQGHRRYAGYIEALMEADIRIEDKRIVWIDTEDVRKVYFFATFAIAICVRRVTGF